MMLQHVSVRYYIHKKSNYFQQPGETPPLEKETSEILSGNLLPTVHSSHMSHMHNQDAKMHQSWFEILSTDDNENCFPTTSRPLGQSAVMDK